MSGPLQKVNCFQVNEALLDIQMEKAFFVDGGIELVFPKGSISAAWNTEIECLTVGPNTFEEVYQQENAQPSETKKIHHLIGQKVIDYNLIKRQYEMIQEDMTQIEEVEITMEINLTFEDQSHLQIALVDYDLHNFTPTNFIYDLGADILVNGGERVLIKN